MKLLPIIAILTGLFLFSCGDDEPELPACIDAELQVFITESCSGSATLELWRFRGQDVYYFNSGTCVSEPFADIFDAECNLLCTLGGISGNGICDGTDWNGNATLTSTLFEN